MGKFIFTQTEIPGVVVIEPQVFGVHFDSIVGGDMVEHGKPDPDIFLLGASILGVEAENCLVLEDSKMGILAAKRAGMHSCFIRMHSIHCFIFFLNICKIRNIYLRFLGILSDNIRIHSLRNRAVNIKKCLPLRLFSFWKCRTIDIRMWILLLYSVKHRSIRFLKFFWKDTKSPVITTCADKNNIRYTIGSQLLYALIRHRRC